MSIHSKVFGYGPYGQDGVTEFDPHKRSFGRGASLLAASLSVYPYTQSSRVGTLVVKVAETVAEVPSGELAEKLSVATGRGWFSAVGGVFSFELLSDPAATTVSEDIVFDSSKVVSCRTLLYPLPCFMSSTQVIFDAFSRMRDFPKL